MAKVNSPHPPLSQELGRFLASPQTLTIRRLLAQTGGRGLYLVIILLSLPFVVPVSVPGASTVLGTCVALLALPLALGQTPWLPRWLGDRPLRPARSQKLVRGSVRLLRFIEKGVRPRFGYWLRWPVARVFNSLLLLLLALLLALPLPSPPFLFSNSLPAYGIIFLAACMMEEDGMMIFFAYAVALGNFLFFGLIGSAIYELIEQLVAARPWQGGV